MSIKFEICDSLTKVLPGSAPRRATVAVSALAGETISFQTAWLDAMPNAQRSLIEFSVRPAFDNECGVGNGFSLSAFHVGLVPANVPAPAVPDDGYFAIDPTLLPDILEPVRVFTDTAEVAADRDADCAEKCEGKFVAAVQSAHRGWNSLWWDVVATPSLIALEIEGSIRETRGQQRGQTQALWCKRVDVRVVDCDLPKPSLHYTQWFHADSLANYYHVEPWSEAHWHAIEEHMKSCARMRVNSTLAPVWTPPLDTAPGTYRRNVQLLRIAERNGKYEFDFSLLDRWIALADSAGIADVEVPHLFTQWGARFAPRFWITNEVGEDVPRFGWDVSATSGEYQEFLKQLLPALREHLDNKVGEEHVWYHVSDEPEQQHLDSYRAAAESVSQLLEGAQVIDALGDPSFQELVQIPVVATDAIPRFREQGINPTWVYYCVAQSKGVSNRFLAQYASRHRMLGFQLYQGRAQGFLHWAFNFYSTQYSLRSVDPYRDTSAGGGFISGDSFVVYPGEGGAVLESLRHRILRAAMDDLAACQLAERLVGRDAVLAVINPDGDLDYNAGWVCEEELLRRRDRVNELIALAPRG